MHVQQFYFNPDHVLNSKQPDYTTWYNRVTVELAAFGCLDIALGLEAPPTDPKMLADFTARAAMAKKIVMNTVDQTIARMGNAESTAADMINYIRKMYEKRHQHSIFDAREQFITLKYAEGTDMAFHVSQVQVLADELTKAGRKVDNVEKAYQLLSSLPASWKQVRDRCLDADTILWEDVQVKVMSAYRTASISTPADDRGTRLSKTADEDRASEARAMAHSLQHSAMMVNPKKRKSDEAYPSTRPMVCEFCEQPNHAEQHCLLREKLQAKLHKQHTALAVYPAEPATDTERLEWFLSVAPQRDCVDTRKSLQPDDWILDSGATRHVCATRSMFVRCRPSDEILKTASGDALPVHGVGDVVVPASSSPTKRDLVLHDCLFVPSAKINCLSVRQLTASGVTISFLADGASLRTREGAVFATRDTTDGLYVIQLTPTRTASSDLRLRSTRVDQDNNVLTMTCRSQYQVTKAAAPRSTKPRVVGRGTPWCDPAELSDGCLDELESTMVSKSHHHALRDAAVLCTRMACRPLDETKAEPSPGRDKILPSPGRDITDAAVPGMSMACRPSDETKHEPSPGRDKTVPSTGREKALPSLGREKMCRPSDDENVSVHRAQPHELRRSVNEAMPCMRSFEFGNGHEPHQLPYRALHETKRAARSEIPPLAMRTTRNVAADTKVHTAYLRCHLLLAHCALPVHATDDTCPIKGG